MWKICGGKLSHFEWKIAVHSKTFAVLANTFILLIDKVMVHRKTFMVEWKTVKVFPCWHFPVYGTANFWQSYLRKAIDHNEYLPTSSPSIFSCIDDKIADLQASVYEKVDGEEEVGNTH